MTKEQRTVAIGAVSGIVMMVVLVWAIGTYLPAPNVQDAYGDRIGYALDGQSSRRCPFSS